MMIALPGFLVPPVSHQTPAMQSSFVIFGKKFAALVLVMGFFQGILGMNLSKPFWAALEASSLVRLNSKPNDHAPAYQHQSARGFPPPPDSTRQRPRQPGREISRSEVVAG